MAPSARRTEAAVAVFAKAPVAGQVKSRLVPRLGAEGAARLHRRLAERAVATAVASSVGPVTVWAAPDASHPFFGELAARHAVDVRAQCGSGLGERMAWAFERAFSRGERLVLVGSDIPALTPGHLRDAASALDAHDAAFIPAEDGGYMLVALSRPLPGLFEGIAWGEPDVMDRTRERLREAGARWTELPPLWDVDRPADYARLEASGLLGPDGP